MPGEKITLNHGSGGRQTNELIRSLFIRKFGMSVPLTDSAILKGNGKLFAFTTDAYVVDPIFFPGGNIGKLAVCGTVNDLAVSGAVPEYISVSFIIEEGFPLNDLEMIVESMADEALNAGVKIVTGDTKVIGKGKCDGIFITTSGTGILKPEFRHISLGEKVKSGDKLLLNGQLGNHAISILGVRNSLNFSSEIKSDCASLNHLIQHILARCKEVHFIRDITRGGLASVLNELSAMTSTAIYIDEKSIPVDDAVRGLCEIMGFDPLSLANEGKALFVIGENDVKAALEVLKSHTLGKDSALIGEISDDRRRKVILNTVAGGQRILEMPTGSLLPRIC